MYPPVLIAGLALLLLALLGAAVIIVLPRSTKRRRLEPQILPPSPEFREEFIGEVTGLSDVLVAKDPAESAFPPCSAIESQTSDAYSLFQRGETLFRIASILGISKADAELLIVIGKDLNRKSSGSE